MLTHEVTYNVPDSGMLPRLASGITWGAIRVSGLARWTSEDWYGQTWRARQRQQA